MKNFLAACVIVSTLLICLISCNKSSTLGADLFAGENANLKFTDTLSFNAISATSDSALMYTQYISSYSYLPIGKMNDPQFGLTESQLFMQFLPTSTAPYFAYDTLNKNLITVDSSFLVFGYAGDRYYGDTTQLQKFSVYCMTEDMGTNDIYSSKQFATKSQSVGSLTFSPKPTTYIKVDTLNTTTNVRDSLKSIAPQIKIPIDTTFAHNLMRIDSASYSTAANWIAKFQGLNIRAENTTNCMLSVDVANLSTSLTGLTVYYRINGDTTHRTFTYATNQLRVANIKTNVGTTSPIASKLNSTKTVDKFLYVQGLVGPTIKMEIPFLQNWKGANKIAINKAEIVFTVNTSDTSIFKLIPQLIAHKPTGALTSDFNDNASLASSFAPYYYSKGYTEFDTTAAGIVKAVKYHVNVSHHLQRMLDGLEGTAIYFSPDPKPVRLSRTVLYGLKDTLNRPKLNITFTKL